MRVSLYMAALLERFRDHVARLGLFPRPGAALVAVSGGPDSVALLDLMSAVAAELGLALVVAHADHGIQAGSRLVGQAVSRLAEQYGLPFELGELGLSPGATETAARHARYAWLRSRSEEHTSELQSQSNLVCRLLLEKKKKEIQLYHIDS